MTITRERARQVVVMAQILGADRPRTIVEAAERLGFVQMDPTAPVARSEHLVLWRRLGGGFRPSDVARLLYEERSLVEHRAFIYPAADMALHRPPTAEWPSGDTAYPRRIRQWLADDVAFRAYVLAEIERRGALRARDLDDRSATAWPRTSGT